MRFTQELFPFTFLRNSTPQHPSTGDPIAFGFTLGLGSGGRRQAPRPQSSYIDRYVVTYQVPDILCFRAALTRKLELE